MDTLCNTVEILSNYMEKAKLDKSHKLHKYISLSTEELFVKLKTDKNTESEQELIKEAIYLNTIFLVAYYNKERFPPNSGIFHDSMQNASVSMLKAMETFDISKGKQFTHYNWGYWRGSVSKTYRDSSVVTIPHNTPNKKPTYTDIETELDNDISADSIFSSYVNEYNDESFKHTDYTTNTNTEDEVYRNELVEWLEEAVNEHSDVLTEDERKILVLHAGLFGNKVHSYKQLSEMRKQEGKGHSCSRISQIFTSAKKKLGAWLNLHSVV